MPQFFKKTLILSIIEPGPDSVLAPEVQARKLEDQIRDDLKTTAARFITQIGSGLAPGTVTWSVEPTAAPEQAPSNLASEA